MRRKKNEKKKKENTQIDIIKYVRLCVYIKREKKTLRKIYRSKTIDQRLARKRKMKMKKSKEEKKPATHTHNREREREKKTHSDWEEETKREI